jgi:hypothetical protein
MHYRRVLFLTLVLALLLTACGVPDSQTTRVQAAQQLVAAQKAVPTALPMVSPSPDSIVSTASAVVADESHDNCPMTRPPNPPFSPPAPYHPYAPSPGEFWYGTDALWTAVPANGVWSDLPHNPEGYTQKVFWWRKGYSWTAEPEPQLTVTGRRLDAQAPPLNVSRATNAFAEDIQSAMLVGVDFPTLGCWEISGRYADAELSFVVQVMP